MSRHRLYCQSILESNCTVTLDGTQAHYLGHVLRVRVDDEVTLFDGTGSQYRANVLSVSRKRIELLTGEALPSNTESPLNLTLIQSVIRNERMDFCVQKTTELGVNTIAPVFTQRSVVKIPKTRVDKRLDHWQKIAISACEQSGRVRIPNIQRPLPFEDAVAAQSNTDLLVLDPWAKALPLHTYSPTEGAGITVCIGPEGGFAPEELEFLRTSGAVSVTCGPRVMRSETAGIVAIAACQMMWGDWRAD